MTTFEKLEEILAVVQTDPGNRGLAGNPWDNLFTAARGDFAAACWCIAEKPSMSIHTGFYIPSADPPAFETDGPLGAMFLWRMIYAMNEGYECIFCEHPVRKATNAAMHFVTGDVVIPLERRNPPANDVWIERAGPSKDGRCYTMRGTDITDHMYARFTDPSRIGKYPSTTIGIGDGGNEIGMGKIPHETIVKNIPNGDLIHCRVPTDHLIVAGVSNWGAYALAAGVYVLRNEKPPANLFDPDYEKKILEIMVEAGPLVDGVTGRQEATVDGLSWDEYVKPLIRMREILEC